MAVFGRALLFVISILLLQDAYGEVTCPAAEEDDENDCQDGAYKNICGECVGGAAAAGAGAGLDACGVCGGAGECVGCDGQPRSRTSVDACGRCLPHDAADRDACVRIASVRPSLLDAAVLEGATTLSLRGARLNRTALPDLLCTLRPRDANPQQDVPEIKMITVEDDVIQVELILKERLGVYDLQCNSSAVADLTAPNLTITVVNSKRLDVTAVDPTETEIEKTIQPIITVPNIAGYSMALCYVRPEGSNSSQILNPIAIEGTKIICSNYTVHQAHILEIGAVFTEDASEGRENQGTPGKITIKASQPKMISAILTNDLQYIYVKFDQNVKGPEECGKILAAVTLSHLGEDPVCSFIANQLIIKFGENPSIGDNTQIQLTDDSQIYHANSDPKLCSPAKGSIKLMIPSAEAAKPRYRVSAPSIVCPKSTTESKTSSTKDIFPTYIRLVPSNGQNLRYLWTVNAPNIGDIPNRGQAENLRLWRNIRGAAKEMKKITDQASGNQFPLNNSMFQKGIQYEFNVLGKNILGMKGENKKFVVEMDESNKIDVVLFGPDIAYADAEYYVDAKVFSCNASLLSDDLMYTWTISGDVIIDNELQRGKRLYIPVGTLSAGVEYVITCIVKASDSNSEILGNGSLKIEVIQRSVLAIIAASEQTIGTGQILHLDASASEDPNKKKGDLQFQWCCYTISRKQCKFPQPGNSMSLQEKFSEAFKSKRLTLPPNSLSIGEYNFTVSVYKDESDVGSTWTKVLVVPGSPPIVNITPNAKHRFFDPSKGVNIQAEVTNVRPDCQLWWSVVQETGFQYFDLQGSVGLGDIVTVSDAEGNSKEPRELPLYIPGPTGSWPGLIGDAQYKLRLTALCPVKESNLLMTTGYADVIIETNTPPVTKPLQVNPDHGEALRTQFEFSTDEAYDSVSDMPLQYNFGYRLSEEETNIFSSSNEDLKAYTLLPAGNGETQTETVITPFLQVCDSHKLCTISEGQKIKTTSPNQLTSEEVDHILKMMGNYLSTGQYSEYLSLSKVTLQTLKKMDDSDLYNKVLQQIESSLLEQLKSKKERLKDNPNTIQDSLDFTNMAVSAINELPMSNNILQQLSLFKDDILRIIQNSIYGQNYRLKREEPKDKASRKKRDTKDMKYTSLNDAKKNVEDLLSVDEKIIKQENFTKKAIGSLLNDIPIFLSLLCKENKGTPVKIESTVATLQVEKPMHKTELLGKIKPLLDKVYPSKLTGFSFVKLLPELLELSTDSVCFGNTLFPQDYLKMQKDDSSLLIDFSKEILVHGIWLFDKESKIMSIVEDKQLAYLRLPLPVSSSSEKYVFQCAAWQDGWKKELCKTQDIPKDRSLDLSPWIECECAAPTYYRIFQEIYTTTTVEATTITTTREPTTPIITLAPTTLQPTTQESTTTQKPTTTVITTVPSTTTKADLVEVSTKPRVEGKPISNSFYNVSFRIDEDFSTTVGNNKEDFKKKLYKEILDQIDMPSNMILEITILQGSIIVRMTLVDTDIKTVDEVVPLIKEIIGSGKFNIYGPDGNRLNVPPQNITVVHDYYHEENKIISYAVGGIVGVSAFAIVALLISAVAYRKMKEKKRLKKMQASAENKVPTYRKFEYEDTIDGSETTLAQYRSGYPTMGTVSTIMGFGMLTGLGTQLNIIPHRSSRYEEGANTTKQKNREERNSGGAGRGESNQKSTTTSKRKRKEKRKSGSETVSLDNLPGTPTDER